jgi:isopenicillin N synthase-like dioxygenase
VNRHRYEEKGLEYLRYMKYHPDPKPLWAVGHTDYNTLTFLFYQPVAGLQVKTKDSWKYVRSNPGEIIVNVADALEFLSGGYLKSTVHRVVRPPGDQADSPRLGLIYFARPEADVKLEPVRSPLLERLGLEREVEEGLASVTAEEWARARIAKDHRFRAGIAKTRETEIIAGVKQKYYD